MKKRLLLIVIACVFFAGVAQLNAERPAAAKRKAHADLNKDGKVGPCERKIEKKWEHDQKAKVNKPWEAKADIDKDGVVEPGEAKAYFRARSVVDRPWEEKADANNDGKVDGKELRVYHKAQMDSDGNGVVTVAERRSYWVSGKAVVNTEFEKRYDTNGDGYLTWDEGKELLKDKAAIIKTKGRAVVNTDLETEFDANSDGIIDRTEAAALLEAIK